MRPPKHVVAHTWHAQGLKNVVSSEANVPEYSDGIWLLCLSVSQYIVAKPLYIRKHSNYEIKM